MKMKYLQGPSNEMEKSLCNLKSDRHIYNFVNLLDEFRLKELYCDATIACDGKKYPVHQVVLSACSDFFANIFATTTCQNPLVVIQDVSQSHLESLLSYVYRGEVNVPQCHLPDFLKAGKSLFIKGLMIPDLEKHVDTESISGTWHEPYYGPEGRVAKFRHMERHPDSQDRHSHLVSNPQQKERIVNHPSIPSPVALNSITTENHLRGPSTLEQRSPYAVQERVPHKRPHYAMEYPQDLSVPFDLSPEKQVASGESQEYSHPLRNSTKWENKESHIIPVAKEPVTDVASVRDLSPRQNKRLKSPEATELPEDKVPAFSSLSDSHGTFQKLIVADESPIKQEPEDIMTECDTNVNVEDSQINTNEEDEEEEAPLRISEEQDVPEEALPNAQPSVPLECSDNSSNYVHRSEAYSRSREASVSPPNRLSPDSHLRRELLRPVPQPVSHMHQQRPQASAPHVLPQSIPHPVIASRESQVQVKSQPQPQVPLREPPPLMKIPQTLPPLVSESESTRVAPRIPVQDVQMNRGNNHLLVSPPPTYRSQNSAPNVCFEIHNQHLGPILVNGGSHISLSSPSAFKQPKQINNNNVNSKNNNFSNINDKFRYDSERPLNLSGFQRPSSKSPDCPPNDDPFLGKIVTNRKKRLRGPKSWEFLVRLLKDPTTNPFLIRWENESNSVFRLVQPAIIAQRWGRRTGKHASDNLSYENFARGLRYHYATGALKPVSEKSFVYRFGPKAIKLLESCDSNSFPYV